VATEAVVRAPPDGYTLLLVTGNNAVNASLYDKLNYDFIRDIAPVGGIFRSPFVLEVHPSLPVKTVSELVEYAKTNRAKLNIASFGTGTGSHLSGELLKMMTGIEMTHVPYRGSAPMLVDLLSGQVQVAFDALPASVEHIRAGKLRPLAVTTTVRAAALPDVPALGEILAGFDASIWMGVGAPKNTPAGIIDKLNAGINAGLADEQIKSRFAQLSVAPLAGSPADFGRMIASETERWGRVIRASNIKPE
jgi:tripartite-type tricarboxylate transporter receptor subunit TctC